jgi:hypothetical protein
MQTNVSQTNATRVQQTREQLSSIIATNFPLLRQFKVKKNGKIFVVRAQYHKRCIRGRARTLRTAIIRFFNDVNQKVLIEPYVD